MLRNGQFWTCFEGRATRICLWLGDGMSGREPRKASRFSDSVLSRIHRSFSWRAEVGRHRFGEHSRVDLELHCNLNSLVEPVGERPSGQLHYQAGFLAWTFTGMMTTESQLVKGPGGWGQGWGQSSSLPVLKRRPHIRSNVPS